MYITCLSLIYRSWSTFVGSGSNNNSLIFRDLQGHFGLLGLSGAAVTAQGGGRTVSCLDHYVSLNEFQAGRDEKATLSSL